MVNVTTQNVVLSRIHLCVYFWIVSLSLHLTQMSGNYCISPSAYRGAVSGGYEGEYTGITPLKVFASSNCLLVI